MENINIWIVLIVNLIAVACVGFLLKRRSASGGSSFNEEHNALIEDNRKNQSEVIKLKEQLAAKEERLAELQREREVLYADKIEYTKENGELRSQIKEQKASTELIEERLKMQFEALSSKIIEDSRQKVNHFNANQLEGIFKGFRENLDVLKKDMNDANHRQSSERADLKAQIEMMVKISEGMNEEAKRLSNALRRDNKSAGDWGESILEMILENSGLVKGESGYELQKVLGDNKLRPDAIVHLPDGRKVIIDSKVSIKDYAEYCNADNKIDQKRFLDNHISSIRNHIKGLSPKNYEKYLDGAVDFVMMFIPHDNAAMIALQNDTSLWKAAYDKKVLIISPTNLITSLKIVKDLWNREARYSNIDNILSRAQDLKNKCEGFISNFEGIGKKITDTQEAYEGALKQLRGKGNIIRQIELLEEAGFESKKGNIKKPRTLKSYEAEESE